MVYNLFVFYYEFLFFPPPFKIYVPIYIIHFILYIAYILLLFFLINCCYSSDRVWGLLLKPVLRRWCYEDFFPRGPGPLPGPVWIRWSGFRASRRGLGRVKPPLKPNTVNIARPQSAAVSPDFASLCGRNLRRCSVNLNTSPQIYLWSAAFSHILAAEPWNVSNDPVIIR